MKPAILTGLALATLVAPAQDLQSVLTGGKASLEIRTRYEYNEDSSTRPSKSAVGLTNRTILGYRTGSLYGISANLQFLDVSTLLGVSNFNSGYNGVSEHSRIAEPHQDRLLQGYLEWKGLKVGRQILSVDNQRLIGPGAWSQAPKSATGATFQGNLGLSWMEVHAGYVNDIVLSDNTHRDAALRFARIRFQPLKELAITPFYYTADVAAYTTPTVPTPSTTLPSSSYQHRGLRADGTWKGLLYEASFAKQAAYREGTAAKVPDALYRMGMVGYRYKDASLKVVRESLEAGFNTPDAALHGYYGWSDRVATTPSLGLVDTYIQGNAKALGLEFEAQYHGFKADAASGPDYGRELDLQVNCPITKSFSILAKYADYHGNAEAAGLTGYGSKTRLYLESDLKKFWLQTTYKF